MTVYHWFLSCMRVHISVIGVSDLRPEGCVLFVCLLAGRLKAVVVGAHFGKVLKDDSQQLGGGLHNTPRAMFVTDR